jgi:hypothetical protein
MAEATSISGRIDVPMATGAIVIAALAALVALNKLTISIN